MMTTALATLNAHGTSKKVSGEEGRVGGGDGNGE